MADELYVPNPGFAHTMNEINRLKKRREKTGKGSALLLLAGSGAGKSFLIKKLQKDLPTVHGNERSEWPVVAFTIPSAPTQKAFGSSLLKAIEDPRPNSGSAQVLLERAVFQLREARTSIICIDNVQDIPERRREGGILQLGNWIRELIDLTSCIVVLLGTPRAEAVTSANAQLRRRVAKIMRIPYFDYSKPEGAKRFRRVLHELDIRLPLAERSELADPGNTRKIYWATAGIMDYIIQLMTEAIEIAVLEGRERLTTTDFERGFEQLFQDAAQGINPFKVGGPDRPLDQEGEPFHNWFDVSNPRQGELC